MPASRVLGVDYGTVRIGLAISDPDGRIASPLQTYTRRGADRDAAFFRDLIRREEVGRIVVGLPILLSGQEGSKAAEARAFGAWLKRCTGLPVIFWDERCTTAEAESALWSAGLSHQKRRQRRDRVAAQIMLQSYLDAGAPCAPPPPS
ncbi:MAG: Holliday junction resolvase RuvX [Gemmataceae bacterium]|nr:Holliday junction resolvase RuvX [Gemmataceae bacterium]MDW8265798.1 Holliday junction resolvase RuvX [Gemmataceae bacterium]